MINRAVSAAVEILSLDDFVNFFILTNGIERTQTEGIRFVDLMQRQTVDLNKGTAIAADAILSIELQLKSTTHDCADKFQWFFSNIRWRYLENVECVVLFIRIALGRNSIRTCPGNIQLQLIGDAFLQVDDPQLFIIADFKIDNLKQFQIFKFSFLKENYQSWINTLKKYYILSYSSSHINKTKITTPCLCLMTKGVLSWSTLSITSSSPSMATGHWRVSWLFGRCGSPMYFPLRMIRQFVN